MNRKPPALSEDQLSALARRATAGDREASERFLLAIGPMVLRVVRQVLGVDHPDVSDVVQEAMLGTLSALSRFRGRCTMGHFVRRVALLTALDARRRFRLRQRLAPTAPLDEAEGTIAREASADQRIDEERRLKVFAELLDELPPAQAEVIALHCVLGYTVAETAQASECSEHTVRGRLAAARNALRSRLEQDPEFQPARRGVS